MAIGQNITRQNCLFESNKKKSFNELKGTQKEIVISDGEVSRHFCSDIWDEAVTHRENISCLRKVKNELEELATQDDINIEIKKVKKHARKKKY